MQAFFDIPRLAVKTITLDEDPALYLEYERELYMLRNGDWVRSRDRLADAVYHALLEYLAPLQSRSDDDDRFYNALIPGPSLSRRHPYRCPSWQWRFLSQN